MSFAAKDWERCYREKDTGWDLRGVTPPLAALLGSGYLAKLDLPARPRVLVPGCGRGHDLKAFAAVGCDVTGVDIVPQACAEARELLALNRVPARVLCRDLFGLLPELANAFDLVYDYTCFCAIPVHLRGLYGRTMSGVLAPGGVWLGLAFPMLPERTGKDGPPYLVREEDLRTALAPGLQIVDSLAAVDSIERRAGAERWFVARHATP